MYNLLLAMLTVKVHFTTFRGERILTEITEITYYFKKIIKNSLQPLYLVKNITNTFDYSITCTPACTRMTL